MHPAPVQIGRTVPDAADPLGLSAAPIQEDTRFAPKKSFSEASTGSRMNENLIKGKEYVGLQRSGLLEIERILLLLSRNIGCGVPPRVIVGSLTFVKKYWQCDIVHPPS